MTYQSRPYQSRLDLMAAKKLCEAENERLRSALRGMLAHVLCDDDCPRCNAARNLVQGGGA